MKTNLTKMTRARDFILIGIVLAAFVAAGWSMMTAPRIGYVDTARLLDGYVGMQEAVEAYSQKEESAQARIDSMTNVFNAMVTGYEQDSASLAPEAKARAQYQIVTLQRSIVQHAQRLQTEIEEEDEKLTASVYHQLETYVKEFGASNNYDLVLNSVDDATVMYGRDATDITDEVLEGLNAKYKGE